MKKTQNSCLDLCKIVLNSSGFDAENFKTVSYEKKHQEITLEVSDTCHDVIFHFTSREIKEKICDDKFKLEEENYVIYLKDVAIKGYHCPEFGKLNKNQLFSLFKKLAQCHSNLITANQEDNKNEDIIFQPLQDHEVLQNLYKLIPYLEDNQIDLNVFKQGIDKLTNKTKKVFKPCKEHFYINGSIFNKKILFKDSDECELLNLGKGKPVSIVYDMLSVMYLVTDQKQRQKYFHDLINVYYGLIKDGLRKVSDEDDDDTFSLGQYERDIYSYIPYVKIELLCYYIQKLQDETMNNVVEDMFSSNNSYKKVFCELVREVYEYIVAPRITREDCFKILRDAIGTNYNDLNYEVTKLEGVLGLIGEYSKLRITVTQQGEEKVFHLFAKLSIMDAPQSYLIFSREEFIYTTFVDELKNLGFEEIVSFLPKCYFVRPGQVLILEDLSRSNYRSLRNDEEYTYELLQLVVKELARQHACCLLYEELTTERSGQVTRLNVKFAKYLEEMFFIRGNTFVEPLINCGINATVNFAFDQFPDIPKDISMETFRERTRQLFDQMYEKIGCSEKYRNVICHGDIWGGNILFKFDENVASDCCFVDYQMTKFCPPSFDLLMFIYLNTNKATRTKYMATLIDDYYNELSQIFKTYSYDLNKIYSYDQFVECCDYLKPQCVCLAAFSYPENLDREKVQNILVDTEKKMHFFMVDKSDVLEELIKDDRIKQRFREIVEELYELCINSF